MKVLMLLVVFLAALLLHYILIVKEKFSDSGSTAGIEFTFPGLINALLEASYPAEETTTSSEASCAQNQNELIRDIRDVVSMEIDSKLAGLRFGPRDTMNGALAGRNAPNVAATAPAATDGLVQGQDYRTDSSCPYAAGQAPPQAALQGIDMNDYIRKDSIPCWGCSLK